MVVAILKCPVVPGLAGQLRRAATDAQSMTHCLANGQVNQADAQRSVTGNLDAYGLADAHTFMKLL